MRVMGQQKKKYQFCRMRKASNKITALAKKKKSTPINYYTKLQCESNTPKKREFICNPLYIKMKRIIVVYKIIGK